MQDKITNVFISDGTDLKADGSAFITITNLGIVGGNMLNVAGSTTIATDPILYIVNKVADGSYKKSVPLVGTHITAYAGSSYSPARRVVWGIGYHRAQGIAANSPTLATIAAGGSIEVNNSTLYSFDLHFVNDKTFYSERPEFARFEFTSAAAATQLTIATQIAAKINASAWGSSVSGVKEVISVVIGDGTGIYGLTGASNYGVEVWSLDINQFRETSYSIEKVNFSVQADSSTGFGATTVTQIQTMDPGMGTYEEVYVAEKVGKRNEGVLNWTKFPIPAQDYLASSTGITSGTLAAFTASGTIGEDQLTFSAAASTQLPAGSIIVLDSASTNVTYTIKYWISTTLAVLETVLSATVSTVTVAGKAWYDMITIETTDVTIQDGSGANQTSKKIVTIALPAITSAATSMATASTIVTSVIAVLNPWITSAPLNAATLSL